MKKALRILAAAAIVIAAALVYFAITEARCPSDEAQIRALLAKGELAIEHKNMKDAMSCVARDYTDDAGNTYDGLRAELQVYFLQQGKYDVAVKDVLIKVAKNTAIAATFTSVSLVYEGGGRDALYSHPVDLIFYKEKTRRCMVLPVSRWKVTCVLGIPTESEDEE